MSYGEFMSIVRQRGGYQTDEAKQVTEAVLTTLGERLPRSTGQHLADQLPTPLDEAVENAPDGAGRSWGVDEFVSHVAAHTGDDEETALTHTRVVFSALSDQITGGEMNKLLSQLPSGYAELFGYSELA
ncbi:DUF2267 domain-containing protein [Streptomyces sp. 6N223]|uniref:DUF2267 domain-containing protein n=1 Tax=Streptomyces sp. 6N223 TaxID=3457412 RepID=UPI003FCF01D1